MTLRTRRQKRRRPHPSLLYTEAVVTV